jgi:hypothetical protein
MNEKLFISALKKVVLDGAVDSVMELLDKPPGRRPLKEIQQLSSWLHSLGAEKTEIVRSLVGLAARQATYNFLSLLDGIAAFEPAGPKGKLELYYVKGDERILLNEEDGEELTSIFKAAE